MTKRVPPPVAEPKILDDAAVESASTKELGASYRELRALYTHRSQELEALLQKIRTETKGALDALKSRGMKTGGDEPYGYQLGPDGKTLRPYMPEQRLIEAIVKLRERNVSFHGIAVRLNAHGQRNREGKPFHTKTIIRIFRAAELRGTPNSVTEAAQAAPID